MKNPLVTAPVGGAILPSFVCFATIKNLFPKRDVDVIVSSAEPETQCLLTANVIVRRMLLDVLSQMSSAMWTRIGMR